VEGLQRVKGVAIDTETTGLSPRTGRARLLQLATPASPHVFVLDLFALKPQSLAPLWTVLAGKRILGHNLSFDLAFLARLGFEPAKVADTMLLSLLLYGPRQKKGFHSLAVVTQRELGVTLNKSEQTSDWSATELTDEQLQYAANDAAVLLPLYKALREKVKAAGMVKVAGIEARALPAIAWMACSGAPFDRPAWEALADDAKQQADELASQLAREAPPRPDGPAWNWNSPKQVVAAFAALGITLESTRDEALAAIEHPLADVLRRHRAANKLATTYGRPWAETAASGGRVFADWRQVGAITGRMASGSPNLQNLPTDPRYRACFRAPEGRVLIKADYSQIELRIAAKVTGDEALLGAYARGEDVHAMTARRLTGKAQVTKAERDLAKPVNFGLNYGLSAAALRRKAKADYGLDLSEADARSYRDAFFAAYPGVARWHEELKRQRWRQMLGREPAEVRTLADRRIVVEANLWHGARANFIVQGTGGDGLKAALGLLWERRADCPGASPILAVHDEIVVEADEGQAEAASAWLKQAMLDGMTPLIDPVPVEVEVSVGQTWGGE
jgi:DNA polymerase-1